MTDRPFLLFGGSACYPRGGFCDFLGAYRSHEEAAEYAIRFVANCGRSLDVDDPWTHIVDVRTMTCVSSAVTCDTFRSGEIEKGPIPADGFRPHLITRRDPS